MLLSRWEFFSNSLNLLDTLAVCLLAFFQTLLETFNFRRQ